MNRVLVVGFTPYGFMEKLAQQYPDTLFVDYEGVYPQNYGTAIIETVNMVDGVLFMEPNGKKRLAYEVACVMTGTKTYEKSNYPVEETAEGQNDQASQENKNQPRYTAEGVMIG